MDLEEQIKLEYCDLTKEELNKKRNYIDDVEAIKKSLERFYGSVEDEELKETILEMERILDDQELIKYNKCVEKVDEFDTLDLDDIVDNDSINREYENDIMGGLK